MLGRGRVRWSGFGGDLSRYRLTSGVDGVWGETCGERGKGDGAESENWYTAYFRRSKDARKDRSAVARSARDDDLCGQGRPPTCGDDGICLGRREKPWGHRNHSAAKGRGE